MKPFSARIIFEINIEESLHREYDEQLLVIFAESGKEAFSQAIQRGKEESETFVNSKGQKVRWQFLGVTEISALNVQRNTAFLNGRTLQPGKNFSFVQYVRHQTELLSQQYHFALKPFLLDH